MCIRCGRTEDLAQIVVPDLPKCVNGLPYLGWHNWKLTLSMPARSHGYMRVPVVLSMDSRVGGLS